MASGTIKCKKANNLGSSVNLIDYGAGRAYIAPTDGYLLLICPNGNYANGRIYGNTSSLYIDLVCNRAGALGTTNIAFVRQGMKVLYVSGTTGAQAYFIPIVE